MDEKPLPLLFPIGGGGGGAVVTNDWCISRNNRNARVWPNARIGDFSHQNDLVPGHLVQNLFFHETLRPYKKNTGL